MPDNTNLPGATHESMGTMDRPRSAVNEVPAISPLNRISVQRQELIELEGLDPDSLDPEMHYRLVNARDQRTIRKRTRQGYKPVPLEGDGSIKTLIEPEDSPDGTVRFGDRILMACPKSMYQERREANFRFNEQRLANVAPTQILKEKAGSVGAEVVDQSKSAATIEQERE